MAEISGAFLRAKGGYIVAQGTITADTKAIDITATWNAAVTFTAIKCNITNTSSNAASKLIDLQVGGVSQFSVTRAGVTAIAGSFSMAGALTGATTAAFSDTVTSTKVGIILNAVASTTSLKYCTISNDGGETRLGTERNSTGGLFTGSTAYASVFGSVGATPVELGTNSTIRLSISSTGAFDFKSGAVSGITTYSGSGTMSLTGTTASTSPTTGILQIAGGVGVAKSLFAGVEIGVQAPAATIPVVSFLDTTNTKNVNLELSRTVSGQWGVRMGDAGAYGLTINQDRSVRLPGISTTASAANAFLDSGDSNNILRSTSSLRYKTLTGDLDLADAWRIVEGAKAITYTPKEGGREHIGLAAEWMHEIDPRITTVDADGRPDWVQYPHLTAPLLIALADVKRRMEAAGLWS